MNKSFQLPYGKSHIDISIPEERVHGVLVPGESQMNSGKSQAFIVQQALENPIGSNRLRELSLGKQNIVLIASDHTRPVPSKIITPLILREIRLGNPHAHITILISTGTHRASTREELIDKFGQQIADNEHIVVHDSVESEVVSIGTLPSGGEILINKMAVEADLLVSEGFIEPHFFAGFSGGRKSVFPGITNRQSVMANHCAEFIAHPKCSTGVLEGNPIHEDMLHAAEAAKLAFIVNVVLDEGKNIMGAFAGHFIAAHLSGTNFIKSFAEVSRQPADIVISTNGGYPLDQNIYQSVKGMTTAESTCNPNGVIILLAECRDGHGGKSFFETFVNDKSLEEIAAEIIARKRGETVVDQWESQILVRVLLKHQVIMVTEASKEMINTFRMHYASTFEEAIEMAESILQKPDATITVIPNGMSVIVKQE